MKNIKDYDLEQLKQELISLGEKPFRAEQIFKWLYVEKVKSFDDMTNLSLQLREKLKANYTMCNFEILKKQIQNANHNIIETYNYYSHYNYEQEKTYLQKSLDSAIKAREIIVDIIYKLENEGKYE